MNAKVNNSIKCRICSEDLYEFIDFGPMPLGNGFLSHDQFEKEYFYQMRAGFCSHCKMVQLLHQPQAELMFHEEYAFFTSSSMRMQEHFHKYGEFVRQKYLLSNDSFIVEIGSNDGTFLAPFAASGQRHLGVEPSANVADVAIRSGVISLVGFFSPELARQIVMEHGSADAITAANVICHIPDFNGVLKSVAILLKADGVFIFEEPYLADVVKKTSYDQFYDEHVYMFSALSVSHAAERQGLELISLDHQNTHGGSMRYTLAKKGARAVDPSVADLIAEEKRIGLDSQECYEQFCAACEKSRDALRHILDKLAEDGKTVVGYAATSKSTTVTNYCGITPQHIAYISDTTPIKQNKFSPGAHIPVKSHDEFKSNYPEYALLFGWNHAEEIMAKEQGFAASGGKWIMYVPDVKIV